MRVLAIDTSTSHGSVALLDGERVLLDESCISDRNHGSTLVPLLQRARGLVERFDCIAVGLGPGSYAGVRIAIATAMGLGMAMGARLVGIPSVAAWECDAERHVAIGDARRETFYFTKVECGICTEGPLLLDAPGLLARIAGLPGWTLLTAEPLALVPDAVVARPRALTLARLAAEERGIFAGGELEPLYLREPHITLPKSR
ncbi:MAG: tRNA (adenosine(37)-N6)-threonylcarbamoyltransferase complex dimerization subunit type 1 TsaB [Chthoniobacteraceae bacterium]